MEQMELKYGCNPHQKPARIYVEEGRLPVTILGGRPGYINFLDAFNAWQLVSELKRATNLPAAASFKHVSPAGAAVGLPLDEVLRSIYFIDPSLEMTPLSCAYARARGADRMSSFGDLCALSDVCDTATAQLLRQEVSDGVIAPGYEPEALELLRTKRGGAYNIIQIDEGYRPSPLEKRDVFGVTFEQGCNGQVIDENLLCNIPTRNRHLDESDKRNLLIALITLKYTQSNSVCYVKDGQVIGVGAGQQSRIHCTRLAGGKADHWWLRQHPGMLSLEFLPGIRRADRDNAIDEMVSEDDPAVLEDGNWQELFSTRPVQLTSEHKRDWFAKLQGVALGSDAFFPFGDNIVRAYRSGVRCIVQPGGSIRDDHVIGKCDQYGIVMAMSGVRLFHH